MRKGFIILVMAITFVSLGFSARNTSAGQSIADRFDKFKDVAKEKAKEKGRELFDREKQAKDNLRDAASEAVRKLIDRYMPGGDNKPAEAVADSVIHKEPWYKAFFHVFFTASETGESNFTDPQQTVTETPVVPANPSNDTPGTITHVQSTPVVPVGPSNENASSPKAAGGHEGGGLVGSQHDLSTAKSDPTSSAPSGPGGGNGNDASASNNASGSQDSAAMSQAKSQPQQWLKAGETTWAQAEPNKEITVNPRETTGSSGQNSSSSSPTSAPAQSAPTSQPVPTPAPVPTPPAPAATSVPASTPAPAPAPTPSNNGHSSGSFSFGGIFVGTVGPSMPRDVGVTPVQHDHDPSGHGGEGGGHAEPPGNHAGPDAHGAEVDHAGHIS
jgi:hypothetical protein